MNKKFYKKRETYLKKIYLKLLFMLLTHILKNMVVELFMKKLDKAIAGSNKNVIIKVK